MLLFHFQHSSNLIWQQKHLLHCNWVTITVYGNSRWFFLINGLFCATLQYKLLCVAGLFMCVTGALSLHSHSLNSVAPSKWLSAAPLASLLLVHADGLETWPFLGSVWVVWYSILFLITQPWPLGHLKTWMPFILVIYWYLFIWQTLLSRYTCFISMCDLGGSSSWATGTATGTQFLYSFHCIPNVFRLLFSLHFHSCPSVSQHE